MEPELILGFRREGDRLVLITPDGKQIALGREGLFDEIARRVDQDGIPRVVTNKVGATQEQMRKAYGVLYDFAKARASDRVGAQVVDATETVLRTAQQKAERAFSKAPRGPSRKYELRRRARARALEKCNGG